MLGPFVVAAGGGGVGGHSHLEGLTAMRPGASGLLAVMEGDEGHAMFANRFSIKCVEFGVLLVSRRLMMVWSRSNMWKTTFVIGTCSVYTF